MKEKCSICGNIRTVYLITIFREMECEECARPKEEKPADPFTVAELHEHARLLSQYHWGVPYDGQIEIVKQDWKRRLGIIDLGGPTIKFSRPVNKRVGKEYVLKILLHELVHWWQYSQNRPFWDDDIEFIQECLRVGAPVSGTQDVKKTLRKMGGPMPEVFKSVS